MSIEAATGSPLSACRDTICDTKVNSLAACRLDDESAHEAASISCLAGPYEYASTPARTPHQAAP
jgi:hypothetical protein